MYGMCSERHHRRDEEWVTHDARRQDAPVAVAERDPDERVGDAERERATAVLSQAFRDGVLRIEEFDQRLAAAYAAVTVRDLHAVTADLPGDWMTDLQETEARRRRAQHRRAEWRHGLRAYLTVMTVLVVIWFATNIGEPPGDRSFWPLWPMLGWGIPLLLSRPGRGSGRSTMPPWDYRSASSKT